MTLVSTDRLTKNLVRIYYNEEGLRFLVNSDSKEIYMVGQETNHSELATEILEVTNSEIKRRPSIASYLVSSMAQIEEDKLSYLVTGMGSLELKLKVGHTRGQLYTAHKTILKFIEDGNYERSDNFKSKVAEPKIKSKK